MGWDILVALMAHIQGFILPLTFWFNQQFQEKNKLSSNP